MHRSQIIGQPEAFIEYYFSIQNFLDRGLTGCTYRNEDYDGEARLGEAHDFGGRAHG